jgi:hypothetical protein
MKSIIGEAPALREGEQLAREEFMDRWETSPQ